MSVANGQEANATTFNGAFMSRTVNTSTVGVVDLNNTSDINSGAQVTNTQQAINEIFDAVGMSGIGDAGRNTYSSNNIVTNGQDRRQAIGALDGAFGPTGSHDHDGSNSAKVSAVNLLNINQFKAEWSQFDVVEKPQVESFNVQISGLGFDVDGAALSFNLAGSLGYVWFNVTDGAFTQADPALAGTGVQVDILSADTAASIATKTDTAITTAAISGITSVEIDAIIDTLIIITYDAGAISNGDAGTAPVTYTLVQNGSSLSQLEGFIFATLTGADYDVVGAGLKFNLADSAGYVWFNVTDGANVQSDPTGTGTGVQVDVLSADDATALATKAKAAIDTAALAEVNNTSTDAGLLTVEYNGGDITDGDAGTSPALYDLVRDGVDPSGVSGLSANVNGYFVGKVPGGTETQVGVVTTAPNNRCEVRDYESQTYLEDAEGQKIYARLVYDAPDWVLYFYTLESGIETPHSLASTTISVYSREVYSLETIPTFGTDAGVLGTLDMTNDIVYATEDVAGKILLANVVAQDVGSANVKGTSVRSAREDHEHRGVFSVEELAEGVPIYNAIVLEGFGGTSISRTGQTFRITSTSAPTFAKEELTLIAGDITNGYIDLASEALLDSIDMVVSGLVSTEGSDYTVSYTGGGGGVTRIDFSAHTPTLIAGDVLSIKYIEA